MAGSVDGEGDSASAELPTTANTTNINNTVSIVTHVKLGVAARATCALLRASGLPLTEIERITSVKASTVKSIVERAIARGFDPALGPSQVMKDEWFTDAVRSGRPRKRSPELTQAVVVKKE